MIVTKISAKNYWSSHRGGMIPQKPHFWGYFDQRKSGNLTENQHSPIFTKITPIDMM
jgi:hypothetical protein